MRMTHHHPRSAFLALVFVAMWLAPLSVLSAPPLVKHGYDIHANQLLQDGAAALEQNDLARARNLLQQALLANPGSARAFLLLGRLELAEGQAKKAQRLLTTALAIVPRNIETLLWAGRAAVARADGALANEHLTQLESICDDCPQARDLAQAIAAMTE